MIRNLIRQTVHLIKSDSMQESIFPRKLFVIFIGTF